MSEQDDQTVATLDPSETDQQEVLDDEPRSILLGIISQLRKGTDLHRVALPTFVLEPRSMLERITDFMSHPELIMATHKKTDPVERFVDVVRYFLSGWHIKPKGVKKPYNPVIGEHFRCRYEYPDGTSAYYVAEQVSHHPPISCWYFASPQNNLVISGDFKPKSKFLGNSAATLMHGGTKIYFTNLDEEYTLNSPNVYARGILFGTMLMELGDNVTIKCQKNDLICELEFKVKGYFSGTYNAIGGKIKRMSTNEILYELSGKWTDILYIKKVQKKNADPNPQEFFNALTARIHPKVVLPEDKQEVYESRRLWSKVTASILNRNLNAATDEKTKIEDDQRRKARAREAEGEEWDPRFFEVISVEDEAYRFRLHDLPKDTVEQAKRLKEFIFDNPPPPRYTDGPDASLAAHNANNAS
ncbi:hypothetical protein BKA69DRAFT_1059245 [Paraphysoderma sedebokerense]|nr:hypothetical protein BKA69DRAFT_1059245 [Paraphysoderma sedebokerense]